MRDNRLLGYLKQNYLLVILLLIVVIANFRWFKFDVFSYGDWNYVFSEVLKVYTQPSVWISNINFGSVDLTLWRMPLNILFGVLSAVGLDYSVIEKLLVFWPTVIGCALSGYLLVKKLTGSQVAGFIGGLVFSFNSYTLATNSQGHILLTLAAVYATFALYFFIRALDENKLWQYIATLFALAFSGYIDFRILYITVGIMVLYFCYSYFMLQQIELRLRIGRLLFLGGGLVLLNLFWLLPAAKSGSVASNDVLNRALFGNSFWSLDSAITLFHPFWTGGIPSWFNAQPVPIYYWVIPVAAFGCLALLKDPRRYFFFALLAVMGIFLSKQIDEPGPAIYPWLFSHVPGFSAFREASKFYYLTILGYAVLLGGTAVAFTKLKRYKKYIAGALLVGVVGILMLNASALLLGRVKHLYSPNPLPQDYVALSHYLEKQDDTFRVLWLPVSPRWAPSSMKHPRISGTAVNSFWKPYLSNEYGEDGQKYLKEKIAALLESDVAKPLLSSASIKYIAVPNPAQDNEEDIFQYYGHDRTFYIDQLSRAPYLKRVSIENSQLVVFENTAFKPHIYTLDNIYKSPENTAFSKVFTFSQAALNTNELAYSNSDTRKAPLREIEQVSISDDLGMASASGKGKTLIANVNKTSLSYKNTPGAIEFYKDVENPLLLNGKSIADSKITQKIGDLKPEPGRQYLLKLKDNLSFLDAKQNITRTIGAVNGPAAIYRVEGDSILADSKYKMTFVNLGKEHCGVDNGSSAKAQFDSSRILKTSSRKSTVCVSHSPVAVKAKGAYMISFDYRNDGGQRVEYELNFNNSDSIKRSTIAPSGRWSEVRDFFAVPDGATEVTVMLKSSADDLERAVSNTQYKDINLRPVSLAYQVPFDTTPQYKHIELNHKERLDFSTTGYDKANLINNPSFENGLWKHKVGDCNNFDDNPKLHMSASKKVATHGATSLELGARRHIACTSTTVSQLNEGKYYQLGFDFNSFGNKQVRYHLQFNDPAGNSVGENIEVKKKQDWQNVTRNILVPYGASEAILTIYTYPPSNEDTMQVNYFDNFAMKAVPDTVDRYYVVGEKEASFVQPDSVSHVNKSATSKSISIKNAKGQFYLILNEAFHNGWRLSTLNSKVASDKHIPVNTNSNGWLVNVDELCGHKGTCKTNPDKSYDFELTAEFTPQHWFNKGMKLSVGAFILCLLVLLGGYISKRRKEVPTYYLHNKH